MLKFIIVFLMLCINVFATIPIYAPEDGGYIYYQIHFPNPKYFPNIPDYAEAMEKYKACMQSKSAKKKTDRYCTAGFTEIRFDHENGSGSLCFLASQITQSYDFYYENEIYPIKKGELLGYLKTETGKQCGVLDDLKGEELTKVYNEL